VLDDKIVFKAVAFKHGVSEADIRNAFEQRLFDNAMIGDEEKNLLIGLDRNGNPLEILYNVLDGEIINVFHAMKCRRAYLHLLKA
jgi:hypothetical protein